MRRFERGIAVAVALIAACNSSSGTPGPGGGDATTLAFQQADPAGDTLVIAGFDHTVPALDLTLVRGDFKGDSLILTLAFSGPIQPASANADNSLNGDIEIDVDNSASTGDSPLSDLYGASANLGVDWTVDLFASTPTSARLYNNTTGVEGSVKATFATSSMTIRVAMDSLGIVSGSFGLVGVVGVEERPTDVFPNSGSIAVQRGASFLMPATRSMPRVVGGELSGHWQRRVARP